MNKFPDGFNYQPEFLSEREEKELISVFQYLNWQEVSLFNKVAKRRVVHFGMNYNYDSRRITPIGPLPPFLIEIISRGALLLKEPKHKVAEILISEYCPQAGIGWHRDAPVFDKILGISLSSTSFIHFRKYKEHSEKFKFILEPCSAYVISDEIRWHWEHRISPVKEIRYSITLRTLKE